MSTNQSTAAQPIDLDKLGFEVFAREACNMPEGIALNWDAAWTKAAYEGWCGALARQQPAASEQASAAPSGKDAAGDPVARVDRIISASGLAEVSVFLESALKVGTVLYAAAAHAAAAPSAEQATPLTDLWMHDDMDRDAAAGAINAPRKDLKAAHKKAVDDVIYWRRRALSAEVSVGTATNTEQPPSGNTGEVAASIDTPEFRVMMNVYRTGSGLKADERFHNIVAHIDAQLARQRQAAPVAWLDRDGRMKDELRSFIEGMSVSMDVSTGDHDAGNRYFGIINEVMDDNNDKNGVTLLVYDAQPNFAAPVPQGAEQANSKQN